MEVILLKEVTNLGNPGELVKVKKGYALNYLLPGKMAVEKTKKSMAILDKQKEEFEKQIAERKAQYESLIEKLSSIGEITIEAKAGEDEKLFGTITNQILADEINRQHQIQLDKKQVVIREHIKMLGKYGASVILNKDFQTEIAFEVIKSAE